MPLPTYDPADYPAQLAAKAAHFEQNFAGFGVTNVAVHASEPLHYRMRAEFGIWHDGDQLDYTMSDPENPKLGRLASYVRDRRVPLEMCPMSNVHTGAAPSIAEHPIHQLAKLRFRVTVNTDNRLMSATSMTREFQLLNSEAGFTLADMEWVTINAMKSAFLPFDERLAIINDQVKPGYAAIRAAAIV